MSDWPSISAAARAAPSPADLSHPNPIAKKSEADVHPRMPLWIHRKFCRNEISKSI
jgi:hypothetical protein